MGVRQITSLFPPSNSVQAAELSFSYHKLRRAELRRNVWTFSCRRTALRAIDTTTMMLQILPWSSGSIYIFGSLVTFNSMAWMSIGVQNQNNQPDTSPAFWVPYFGPLTCDLWQSSNVPAGILGNPGPGGYYAGEIVYYPEDPFAAKLYLSLNSGNTDTPGQYPAWNATTVYNKNDTIALITNIVSDPGNIPVFSFPGKIAVESQPYMSLRDLNVGIQPGTDNTTWAPLPPPTGQVDLQTGQNWLQIDAQVFYNRIIWPIGAGPLSQSTTRNAFRLPAGYLREAPQQPKDFNTYLGAPGGLFPDDWEYNGQYLISSSQGPILYRFAADVTDVTQYDDMFCEGFGARLGYENCERVTQSTGKMAAISNAYKTFMSDARAVNSIEQGETEPPVDDYIACRL